MKKLFLMGTFALLSTTLFSCTADDYEEVNKTKKLKNLLMQMALEMIQSLFNHQKKIN
jgi:hypothetical protein